MDSAADTSAPEAAALAEARARLDALDDGLLDALLARVACARALGALKGARGAAAFRLGREADVLRRLVARWDETAAPKAEIARCWRAIIAMTARAQVAAPVAVGGAGALMRAAVAMCGARDDLRRRPSPERALAAVAQGEAALCVLPWFAPSGDGAWWRKLMRADDLSILGAYPLIAGEAGEDCPRVALVGRGPFDASSDDRRLYAVEGEGEGATRLVVAPEPPSGARALGGWAARADEARAYALW